MLVQDPRLLRGVLSIQGSDPTLRDLRTHRFLVDSGADCNIVFPALGAALLEPTDVPSVTIHGVCGNMPSTGAGIIRLGFWQDDGPVSSEGTWSGAAAFDLDSLGSDRRVWRARESAFPPIDTADKVSERFNVTAVKGLTDFPTLLGNVGVTEYTVSPTKTYGDGLVQRAQGRAPASHHVLNHLPAAICERHLPGMVWWTDISNPRDPDYQGNT